MENGQNGTTEQLVDIEEMAGILGVHPDWIYERTRKRPAEIPCVRVGKRLRFDPDTVIAFLSENPIQR